MNQIAVLRAEWLSQIAEAIEGAQKLAWQLRMQEGASLQARELYNRLETVRSEVESLRSGRGAAGAGRVSDSDWLRALGWSGSLGNPDG